MKLINIIPKMTSNTAPSGIASASATYSSIYDAFQAFDGILTTRWVGATANPVAWLAYKFTEGEVIGGYSISIEGVTQAPKNWRFEGSNDGVTWVTLDSKSNITDWTANSNKIFIVNNKSKFLEYRVNISDSVQTNQGVSIVELEMYRFYEKKLVLKNPATNQHYSLAEKTLIPLSDTSSKNMILHGIEAGKEIQLDEAFDKIQYVNELSKATQGISGKIITQPLLEPINKILKISEVRI